MSATPSAAVPPSCLPTYLVTAFCSLLGIFYGFAAIPQSGPLALGLRALPLLTVAHWLVLDGRFRGRRSLETWGVLFYVAWPVLLPLYALRTRGRSGWVLLLELYALVLASALGTVEGMILRALLAHRR